MPIELNTKTPNTQLGGTQFEQLGKLAGDSTKAKEIVDKAVEILAGTNVKITRGDDTSVGGVAERKTFGANVCEMELGAIAHVASRAGVKVHSWKAISDVAGNETQADQYKRNLKACLDSLSAKIPALFKAV